MPKHYLHIRKIIIDFIRNFTYHSTVKIILTHPFRLLTIMAISAGSAHAQTSPQRPQPAPTPAQGKVTPSGKFTPKKIISHTAEVSIKQIDPNTLDIGGVILHKEERTLTFAVTIALEKEVPLEYLLVHEFGKTHESLLKTKVSPKALHLAALLLNGEGKRPEISLTWKKNGPDAHIPLSTVLKTHTNSPHLAPDQWSYIGSKITPYGFAAQNEGSFITLIHDPSALICHLTADKLNKDNLYTANIKKLPLHNPTLRLIIKF